MADSSGRPRRTSESAKPDPAFGHDYKEAHHFPIPKTESVSGQCGGRVQLTNGMTRLNRILKSEEVKNGRSTRWLEMQIVGEHQKYRLPSCSNNSFLQEK